MIFEYLCNNLEDSVVIVTADHETGNLQLASSKDKINDELYLSTNHTSKDIKYFIYSKNEPLKRINEKIDNTDIYMIIKQLLSLKETI